MIFIILSIVTISALVILGLVWDSGYNTAMLQVKLNRIPVKISRRETKHISVKDYRKGNYDNY